MQGELHTTYSQNSFNFYKITFCSLNARLSASLPNILNLILIETKYLQSFLLIFFQRSGRKKDFKDFLEKKTFMDLSLKKEQSPYLRTRVVSLQLVSLILLIFRDYSFSCVIMFLACNYRLTSFYQKPGTLFQKYQLQT